MGIILGPTVDAADLQLGGEREIAVDPDLTELGPAFQRVDVPSSSAEPNQHGLWMDDSGNLYDVRVPHNLETLIFDPEFRSNVAFTLTRWRGEDQDTPHPTFRIRQGGGSRPWTIFRSPDGSVGDVLVVTFRKFSSRASKSGGVFAGLYDLFVLDDDEGEFAGYLMLREARGDTGLFASVWPPEFWNDNGPSRRPGGTPTERLVRDPADLKDLGLQNIDPAFNRDWTGSWGRNPDNLSPFIKRAEDVLEDARDAIPDLPSLGFGAVALLAVLAFALRGK